MTYVLQLTLSICATFSYTTFQYLVLDTIHPIFSSPVYTAFILNMLGESIRVMRLRSIQEDTLQIQVLFALISTGLWSTTTAIMSSKSAKRTPRQIVGICISLVGSVIAQMQSRLIINGTVQ